MEYITKLRYLSHLSQGVLDSVISFDKAFEMYTRTYKFFGTKQDFSKVLFSNVPTRYSDKEKTANGA